MSSSSTTYRRRCSIYGYYDDAAIPLRRLGILATYWSQRLYDARAYRHLHCRSSASRIVYRPLVRGDITGQGRRPDIARYRSTRAVGSGEAHADALPHEPRMRAARVCAQRAPYRRQGRRADAIFGSSFQYPGTDAQSLSLTGFAIERAIFHHFSLDMPAVLIAARRERYGHITMDIICQARHMSDTRGSRAAMGLMTGMPR